MAADADGAGLESVLSELRASTRELQLQLQQARQQGDAVAAALGDAEVLRAGAAAALMAGGHALLGGGGGGEASVEGAAEGSTTGEAGTEEEGGGGGGGEAVAGGDEAGGAQSPSKKKPGKLEQDPAMQAEWWVTAVTGRARPEGETLQQWLRSGVVLCELINTLQEDLVPRVSHSAKPFTQMENVEAYVRACTKYGVPAQDIFVTVDLFEGKNMPAVVRNLHSLGRVAQAKGFTGPTLGAKLATSNRRSFTPAQIAEAVATPSRWTNRGSVGASGDTEIIGGQRIRSMSGSGFRGIVGPRENVANRGAYVQTRLSGPGDADGDGPTAGAPTEGGAALEATEEASTPEERAEAARARVAERVERARLAPRYNGQLRKSFTEGPNEML